MKILVTVKRVTDYERRVKIAPDGSGLVTEGMKAILEGENPRLMEQRLHAFVSPKERQSNFG